MGRNGSAIGSSDTKSTIKITCLDNNTGELKLLYNKGTEAKRIPLAGDQQLKTATFLVDGLQPNSMDHGFDFTLEAGEQTEDVVVSMVRVIDAQQQEDQ